MAEVADSRAPVIHYSEMNEVDKNLILEICIRAMTTQEKADQVKYHKDVAQAVKVDLDSQKGGSWHVVLGKSFGSFVSHETKNIIYFSVGDINFFVWRHG